MTRQDLMIWLTLSFVWGASFILIKVAGESFPPLWVALLRSCFGAAVLWAAFRLRREAWPPRELLVPLVLAALLNNALPWTLFPWGEQTVSSGIASILNATTPLFSLGIALAVRDAQATVWVGLGVLIGLLGVGLTVSGSLSGGHATVLGVQLILLATLSYAVATALSKRYLQGISALSLATSQLSLSALMLLPLALLTEWPSQVSAASLAGAAALGVFGSGLAYLLFYTLLARTSATQTTAITYSLPVWGLLWGYLAGERFGLLPLLGVVVVIAGLVLLNWRPRPRQAVA
ncbi:ABC transporter permease [Deinococcus piscis]|uniref:ABC transporter permease n=1 Tax=Deinococcus piscis TaxID=394230 RepID=A0ABQ3KAX1_9DEIO|nr:DMT family transporter [Deinococcus piscis]GHG10730.1 ABC transporter permease [Deinococcus piscis]